MDTAAGKTTPRLIAMAVSLVGDSRKICVHMRCSEEDFRAYCDGRKEAPWPELDRLISLIVHEQGLIIAANRDNLAKRRKEEK